MIRDAQQNDFNAIAEIYNHYIRHTVVTFEESEIDQSEISIRVDKVKSAGLWWLVFEQDNQIIGYAYAAKWHERSAYRNTVEVSVYLHHEHADKGYGQNFTASYFPALKIRGYTLPLAASPSPILRALNFMKNSAWRKLPTSKRLDINLIDGLMSGIGRCN